MNDKVYVKIRGLSAQEAGDAYKEAEDIEIISVGRYTRRAGKEYIRYEEVYDGESAKSDTLIKISEDRVEISLSVYHISLLCVHVNIVQISSYPKNGNTNRCSCSDKRAQEVWMFNGFLN